MNALKSFIYLDEYKMYSLSSQIFEGITEYLISSKSSTKEDHEEQKGPIGSGRLIADIIREKGETQEKRFLHDYSYQVFETYLLQQKKVVEVDESTVNAFREDDAKGKFVKVRARATFNDIQIIKETISRFNKIGEAFAYITNMTVLEEAKKQFEAAERTIGDRNKRAKAKAQVKNLTNINRIAKEQGLQQDQRFLDSLALLFSFGFGDQFEVQQSVGDRIFSANLKRSALREDQALLIRKYSRITEREIVVFGMVTQGLGGETANMADEVAEPSNMKKSDYESSESSFNSGIYIHWKARR